MSLNLLPEPPPGAGWKDLDATLKECIARFSHPQDPLAAWKASFDEWIDAVRSFHEAEDRHIYQNDQPDEMTWRFHRFLLHSLIGRGEHLALQLLSLPGAEAEKMKQLEFVDSFLTDLRLTVETWHKVGAEDRPNPLASYL
ncbi:MAG: hypothetical protein HYY24_29430 [Verrucomicrobia bacterium]|nr:hypothetical protein [Verrucomicrobiota bacterium]